MYAIDEEETQVKKDSLTKEEPNRPSTPVFDSKPDTPETDEKNDGNDENERNAEESYIFEQIKNNVKELDSDDN